MFQNVKVPRNLCQYRLFRGAADFGNLKQWDLYEKGYSFLTVVTVPEFIKHLASNGTAPVNGTSSTSTTELAQYANIKNIAARLLNNFVYILEHEFRGLTGLSNLTAETSEIGDGISTIAMINKVVEDTSITIQMSFFEKSGRTITKFCEFYLRGIKDTRTQGKTYWGLIESGAMEAGFQNEVFSLLYYVTDNTYRHLEGAYLFMCAQITEVPLTDVFETEKGSYSFPEINVSFNCFPVTDDTINEEASRMLDFILSTEAGKDQLVVDTQSTTIYKDDSGNDRYGYYTGEQNIRTAYGLRLAGSDATTGYVGAGGGNGTSADMDSANSAYASHTLSAEAQNAYSWGKDH
jgi:hypothetical protein